MVDNDKIDQAATMIHSSRWVVGFTGAGVSEESGISTFRDPDGLWNRYPEGASGGIMGILKRHPEAANEMFSGILKTFKSCAPNPGHYAFAELERMGYLKSIITQNGDNLHQDAGSSKVYELHGNAFRFRCLECARKKHFPRAELFSFIENILSNMKRFSIEWVMPYLPSCECGGTMRPDVVTFGESVHQIDEATAEAHRCDLMLISGTSGVVYPAAILPVMAKERGAKLIEINPIESALTARCDLFLPGKTEEVLPIITQRIKEMRG